MQNTRLSFIMLKNKNNKFFLLLSLIFIVIIVIFLSEYQLNTLRIIDLEENKLLWQQKINDGDQFSLKYIHSVAKTPVIENFEIKADGIVLTGTEYQSYGAGLPTSTTADYIVKNDRFIIENLNQPLSYIQLRVSTNVENEFIIDNTNIKLYKLVDQKGLIEISTEKISYFRFLRRRF